MADSTVTNENVANEDVVIENVETHSDVDLGILSRTFQLPMSFLGSLTQSPTVALVNEFLQGLSGFAQESVKLKAENTKLTLEAGAENNHFKREADKAWRRVKQLEDNKKECEEERNRAAAELLESKAETIRAEQVSSDKAEELRRKELELAEQKKSHNELVVVMAAKNRDANSYIQGSSENSARLAEVHKKLNESEARFHKVSHELAGFKVRVELLQAEVLNANRSKDFYEQELAQKTKEHAKFRKDKVARLATLQQEHSETKVALERSERRESEAKKQLENSEERFTQSLATIKKLKEDHHQETENLRNELEAEKRICEMHKSTSISCSGHATDAATALDVSHKKAERLTRALENAENDKALAQRRVAELESQLAKDTRESSPDVSVSGSPIPAQSPGQFKRKKRFRSMIAQSPQPKSETQTAIQNGIVRGSLRGSQTQNNAMDGIVQRLTRSLDFLNPEMGYLRGEKLRVENGALVLANQSNQHAIEKADLATEVKYCKGRVHSQDLQRKLLEEQVSDLALQCRGLMGERDALLLGEEFDRAEFESKMDIDLGVLAEGSTPTAQFVRRHLTRFSDAKELMAQNLSLRQSVRQLAHDFALCESEAKETADKLSQESQDAKAAAKRMKSMQNEIEGLTSLSKSHAAERDILRSMLMHRKFHEYPNITLDLSGNSPNPEHDQSPSDEYSQILNTVKQGFEDFRQESAKDAKFIRDQLNESSRKNAELSTELIQRTSDLDAANARLERVESTYEMLKNESNKLELRYSTLLQTSNTMDAQAQEVALELVDCKSMVDSLQRECANLRAEKTVLVDRDMRRINEIETYQNQNSVTQNLLTVTQKNAEEQARWDADRLRNQNVRIESLQSEIQDLKHKLQKQEEEVTRLEARLMFDQGSKHKRVEDLIEALKSAERKSEAQANTINRLEQEISSLTSTLDREQERLRAFNADPTLSAGRARSPTPTQAPTGDDDLTPEQQLKVKVSKLERDLARTKDELEQAMEQTEEFRTISQSCEERMNNASETHSLYHKETEALLENKNAKISELETKNSELEGQVLAMHPKFEAERQASADREHSLNIEVKALTTQNQSLQQQATCHLQDLKEQTKISEKAQTNYDDEVERHATSKKALKEIRVEADKLKLEIRQHQAEAETLKKDLLEKENMWLQQKSRQDQESVDLSTRYDQVLKQNDILHTSIQKLTSQQAHLEKSRRDTEMNSEMNVEQSDDTGLAELQEIIDFLRRDGEITRVQKALSDEQVNRLTYELENALEDLHQARIKLAEEQEAAKLANPSQSSGSQLLNAIAEANLFRQTCSDLRTEIHEKEVALESKNKEIEKLSAEVPDLQSRERRLTDTVAMHKDTISQLEAERDHWHNRVDSLLGKYGEPTDEESLKENLVKTETELAELRTRHAECEKLQETLEHERAEHQKRLAELRSRLTEQFKARSRELTGRLNAQSAELQTAVQEKETLVAQIASLKAQLDNPAPAPAVVPSAPVGNEMTTSEDSIPQNLSSALQVQVNELEEKIRQLEAALSAKDVELQSTIEKYTKQLDELKNMPSASAGEQSSTEVNATAGNQPDDLPNLTDFQIRQLVQKNVTIRNIVKNNILNQVNKEKSKFEAELSTEKENLMAQIEAAKNEKQTLQAQIEGANNEISNMKAKHEIDLEERLKSATELGEKKTAARLSMSDQRWKTAQAKVDVVKKAAEETPQTPVVEVWKVAQSARAVPKPQPPVSGTPPAASNIPTPKDTAARPNTSVQVQETQPQPTSLPNKPPQAGRPAKQAPPSVQAPATQAPAAVQAIPVQAAPATQAAAAAQAIPVQAAPVQAAPAAQAPPPNPFGAIRGAHGQGGQRGGFGANNSPRQFTPNKRPQKEPLEGEGNLKRVRGGGKFRSRGEKDAPTESQATQEGKS
ncbi:Viral A-type inclusion protein repeat containing protein [Penicillium herquei]|nr:Viral A-type inclusion protein repeat containing protein [Penicillium herquei]